jgi:hypothetical protein
MGLETLFDIREVFKKRLTPNDRTSWNMNVFTTHALRWTLGDLHIDIIHKKSIPSIAKLISTVPDSNVKKCRLCEKTTEILVHVCCNGQYSFEIQ